MAGGVVNGTRLFYSGRAMAENGGLSGQNLGPGGRRFDPARPDQVRIDWSRVTSDRLSKVI